MEREAGGGRGRDEGAEEVEERDEATDAHDFLFEEAAEGGFGKMGAASELFEVGVECSVLGG